MGFYFEPGYYWRRTAAGSTIRESPISSSGIEGSGLFKLFFYALASNYDVLRIIIKKYSNIKLLFKALGSGKKGLH